MNEELAVNVSNSTITDNRSGTAGGGGIASNGYVGTFTTITNTIVSGNIISGPNTPADLSLFNSGTTDTFIIYFPV